MNALKWLTPSDAYAHGFRDGYHGVDDTRVEQFHSAYEKGQLSGMAERKALTNSARTVYGSYAEILTNGKRN